MARNYDEDDLTEEELDEEPAEELEEDVEEEPLKPRARVTLLTLSLCFLNVLAALGFAFLLMMDYSKRQAWSYAVFQHDLALRGLPLEEEANGPSASQVTFPRQKLDAEELKNVMTQRGVKGSGDVLSAVLVLSHPILPEHMTPEVQSDWFKGLGEPVKTLEDEIRRVKKELPDSIARAAQEVADGAKTEAEKRQKLEKILLSLAYTVHQVEAVNKKVKDLSAAQVDDKLREAAQRRILVDILAPLDFTRPGEVDDRFLEQVSLFDTKRLEQLQNLLLRRMASLLEPDFDPTLHFGKAWAEQPRDSIDKRQAIAFFLFTLSQVKKPDGTPLYPPDRVPAIVGLHQYAVAAQALSHALVSIQERLLDAIKADRDGAVFQGGKDQPDRTSGFVDHYQAEIQRLRTLMAVIKSKEARLEDMQLRFKGHKKNVEDRELQVKELTDKILEARAQSAKQQKDLDRLQEVFFQAKVRLRDAQQQNLRLEQELGLLEGLKGAQRGGKPAVKKGAFGVR